MIPVLALILTIWLFTQARKAYRTSGGDLFHVVLPFLFTYWFLYVLKFLLLQHLLYARFPEDLISRGLLFALAGLAAFSLGNASGLAERLARRWPRAPVRWPRGALFPYAMFIFLAAAAGEALFIGRSGGFEHFFSTPRGAGDYQGNTAYLYNLRWLSVPAAAIILVETLLNGMHGIQKFLGASFISAAIVYFFLLGQRSAMLAFGLLLAAAWFYAHRGSTFKALRLLCIFLPFCLAIGFIGLFRGEFHLNSSFKNSRAFFQQNGTGILTDLSRNLFFTGSDPDNPHQEPVLYLSVLNAVPDRVDYDYGKPYLNYLVHWIPRLWWPDKPNYRLEGAKRLERAMGTDLQGPVLTVLGYFYANLGAVGILLGMYLTGVGLSAIYQWFRAQPGSLGALLIYLQLFHYGIAAGFGPGIFTGWDTIMPFSLLPVLGGFGYLRLTAGRYQRPVLKREGLKPMKGYPGLSPWRWRRPEAAP